MGTRSLTFIHKKKGESFMPITAMYRQFDGYPSGHGNELAAFLDGFIVVNGIGGDVASEPKVANGAGCLAAQLIGYFKSTQADGLDAHSAGGFYVEHPNADPSSMWIDYCYHVHVAPDQPIKVIIEEGTRKIYSGDVPGLIAAIAGGGLG